MKHMENENQGNPKPEGNISYFNSIHEKEKICKESVGYNTMRFNYEEAKQEK